VRQDAEAATEESSRSTEVDQVSAARDWLRRHGVDPDAQPEAGPGSDPEPGGATLQGGYDRSRRAPSSGTTGWSVSRRSTRGRRSDAEAAAGDEVGGTRAQAPEPDADPEEVARGIVLNKLAVQARTRVELERALQGRDVPEEAAAAVLDRLTEVGLVDDVTFAHDWVASRQQRRHLSRTALRRELQTKGVDRDVIDEALADVEGADEHRAALDLASRRASTMGGLSREVAYRRLGGALARRGFSASITAQVLNEVLGELGRDD
jgi:regulatory protein